MLVFWVKESRANPLKPLAWQMRSWSILPWLKHFDEITSFSWCPSGWELLLCAGQSVPQRWRNRFAFPSARCRDLQQGWCSHGRARLPSALPRALGLCVRWRRECHGVAGGAQRGMAVPRCQESRGHRASGPSLGCGWSRCQPRCRFKAPPEEQMITGQLRLHNLFWV